MIFQAFFWLFKGSIRSRPPGPPAVPGVFHQFPPAARLVLHQIMSFYLCKKGMYLFLVQKYYVSQKAFVALTILQLCTKIKSSHGTDDIFSEWKYYYMFAAVFALLTNFPLDDSWQQLKYKWENGWTQKSIDKDLPCVSNSIDKTIFSEISGSSRFFETFNISLWLQCLSEQCLPKMQTKNWKGGC